MLTNAGHEWLLRRLDRLSGKTSSPPAVPAVAPQVQSTRFVSLLTASGTLVMTMECPPWHIALDHQGVPCFNVKLCFQAREPATLFYAGFFVADPRPKVWRVMRLMSASTAPGDSVELDMNVSLDESPSIDVRNIMRKLQDALG